MRYLLSVAVPGDIEAGAALMLTRSSGGHSVAEMSARPAAPPRCRPTVKAGPGHRHSYGSQQLDGGPGRGLRFLLAAPTAPDRERMRKISVVEAA